MPDFAAACATGTTGLTHAGRWGIIMEDKPLRLLAAAVSVDHLGLFNRRQRGQRQRLRFTALENRRTVRPWQHADLTVDRPQILVAAAVDAFLFFQNAFSECFLLHVIE